MFATPKFSNNTAVFFLSRLFRIINFFPQLPLALVDVCVKKWTKLSLTLNFVEQDALRGGWCGSLTEVEPKKTYLLLPVT